MTWELLRPSARAYVAAVILLGALPLAAALSARPPKIDVTLVAVMGLAAVVGAQKLVLIGGAVEGCWRRHQMSTMSLGFPVVLGSLLCFGVENGILVAFASAIGASLYPRRHPVHQALFTSTNLGLSALASGWTMSALAPMVARPEVLEGRLGLVSPGVPLLSLMTGTLIYYAVNTTMVATAVALSQGKRPLAVWRGDFLWTGPGFVAGGAIVGIAMALAVRFGGAVALLSLLCLYLIHYSYRIYLQKMHQLEENQQALSGARDELETRVRERTAELARSNEILQVEVAERKRGEEARQQLIGRLVTAQEEERRRIARELHDQMGQYLTALMLCLQSLKESGEAPSPVQTQVDQLQALTDQLMQEVHRLARELRPAALDDLGLPAALRRCTEGWARYSGVAVDFHSHDFGAERLPPHIEVTLYRVVQEALTNVLRHARARRVGILLERHHDDLCAIVEDDGVGFDAESVTAAPDAHRGLGLLGMQERVGLVGGTLEIESSQGAGTAVFVRVPLGDRSGCAASDPATGDPGEETARLAGR